MKWQINFMGEINSHPTREWGRVMKLDNDVVRSFRLVIRFINLFPPTDYLKSIKPIIRASSSLPQSPFITVALYHCRPLSSFYTLSDSSMLDSWKDIFTEVYPSPKSIFCKYTTRKASFFFWGIFYTWDTAESFSVQGERHFLCCYRNTAIIFRIDWRTRIIDLFCCCCFFTIQKRKTYTSHFKNTGISL